MGDANREDLALAELRLAHERVTERVAAACDRSARDNADVTVVAVSKTVPIERLRWAAAAGISDLGENRVQEAASKVSGVAGVSWHLVGPLQANKARRALELFDVIQTVDSMELARRLDRLVGEGPAAGQANVFVQVNVDADPAKAGFIVHALERDLDELLDLPHLVIGGLMTIGRLADDPEAARPTFRALRVLSERLRIGRPRLGSALSMGMTDDFEAAVEEGATHVRVGRAIFGERPAAVR
jgi:hypothetical protein